MRALENKLYVNGSTDTDADADCRLHAHGLGFIAFYDKRGPWNFVSFFFVNHICRSLICK